MSVLTDRKIGTRIALALLLPVLGLAAFALVAVTERSTTATEMAELESLAGLAPEISAVVHELQKERGASAGFIGSKGEAFADQLPAQRNDTDAAVDRLAASLDAFDAAPFGTDFAQALSDVRTRLNERTAVRTKVSELQMSVPDMAGWYTKTIAQGLDLIENMALLSSNAEVTRTITAYIAYLQGKERAGIERAMGASGFGAGDFAPPVYQRFMDLIGQQRAYHDTFGLFATPDLAAAHRDVMQSTPAQEVERLRTIALDSIETGDLQGVTGPEWFKTITGKINLLKSVEDLIAAHLEEQAKSNRADAQAAFWLMSVVAAALLAATAILVTVIVRGITGPIRDLTGLMGRLAEGDKEVHIPGTRRGDEVGAMSRAVEVFREHMIENDRMQAEREREQAAQIARARHVDELTQDFDRGVSELIETVSSATTELEATAQSMSSIAEETSRQATTVAAAAEEASTNVDTVAASAEELSASIDEIGRRVQHSAAIAGSAAERAGHTEEIIKGLAQSAEQIGEVVQMINDIADQTNLLALNATIEAARAGDAGKGFAVVAGEVKNLAGQTSKATEQITGQIQAVQTETRSAVHAIEEIVGAINEVSETASAIASAVEQQNAATQEIARNVQQASSGTQEVSSNIGEVSSAAGEAGTASQEVLDASRQLAEQSDSLRALVRRFLEGVRAA